MDRAGLSSSVVKHAQNYFSRAGAAIVDKFMPSGGKCVSDGARPDKEDVEMNLMVTGIKHAVKKLSGRIVDGKQKSFVEEITKKMSESQPMRILVTNENFIVTNYTLSSIKRGTVIAESTTGLSACMITLSLVEN